MQSLFEGFRNITNFSGRTRRSTYWSFWVLSYLSFVGVFVIGLLSILLQVLLTSFFISLPHEILLEEPALIGVMNPFLGFSMTAFYGSIPLYWIMISLADVSMKVRRLHDAGYSGALVILEFIFPFVGWLVLLPFLCQDSQPHENAYGPNPKQDEQKLA